MAFILYTTPPSFFIFVLLCQAASAIIAAPILAPNISSCHMPYNLPSQETPFNCCAPSSPSHPTPFLPNQSDFTTLKIRRPAHAVDQTFAHQLARGYTLMKALPDADPRSFSQQANIHCAYCNTVYTQMNSSQVFQVHGSWLFFAFHRWYLYFHERILAKLLQDDTFALTFWNYDHPNGSTMPWIFTDIPELVDLLRNAAHLPPAVAAIDYAYDTDERTPEKQIEENTNAMYRTMIKDATTQYRFFGMPYRQDDNPQPGYGSVEKRPHNTVHLWTGNVSQVGWKDMGSFYAAARDPIFYAHHANIDRLWQVWKSIGNNTDIDDPDYLDSEFAFYDENAQLVKVKVRDALDTTNLGYAYENVDNPWMAATSVRLSTGVAKLMANDSLCTPGDWIKSPCSAIVQRDLEMASMGVEEELVISGIEWQLGSPTDFEIFINLPTASNSTTTGCWEYVGFFSSSPQFSMNNTDDSYDITSTLRELNLTKEENIIVTIVPKGLVSIGSPASITKFEIVYVLSELEEVMNSDRRQVQ